MSEYAQETAPRVFAQARECYEDIEGWLCGPEAGAMTHAELEDELGTRGRELLRRLYQGQLDLRAAGEQRRQGVIAAGCRAPGRNGAMPGRWPRCLGRLR